MVVLTFRRGNFIFSRAPRQTESESHNMNCDHTVKPHYNAITLSPGGIFWDRGISEAHYIGFAARFFFFKSCIYFLTANCFIFYVLCHDVLLPLTMSIVYLFVSVLLLYQSVIKIDVPNKWASACVQPAIADG